MPKKNGVSKTFSFDKDIVTMLNSMCEAERRTQTNLIELLIAERYSSMRRDVVLNGREENGKA